MPIQRTHENTICSKKFFKGLVINAIGEINQEGKKYRMDDDAIRHLRLTMIRTVDAKEHLLEALSVILFAITGTMKPEKTTTRIRKADIDNWLVPGEDDEEVEWEGDQTLSERPLYGVRRLLDRKRIKGVTYYLVDWEQTWETRKDVGNTLIVAFEKARRALVRKTYIEDQAKEAGKQSVE